MTTQTSSQAATPLQRVSTRSLTLEHIRMGSTRSFDEVKAALEAKLGVFRIESLMPFMQKGDMAGARAELERLAAPTGLSILYALPHGDALAMVGKPSKAIAYGIGNVLTAASMNRHDLAAGLYAPIRVILYEGADGSAVFEYDQPSSSFALFGNPAIDRVAAGLDETLGKLLMDVSQ